MKAFVTLIDNHGQEALRLPMNPDNVAVVETVRDLFLCRVPAQVQVQVQVQAQAPIQAPTQAQMGLSNVKPRLRGVRHSLGFRKAAVHRWAHGNASVAQVARDLRIPYSTLDHWVREEFGTTDRARIQIRVEV